MMLKIEALIQPFKLDEITLALEGIGVEEGSHLRRPKTRRPWSPYRNLSRS